MLLRAEEQGFLLKCIQVPLGIVVGFISGAALPTYIGGFWAWSTGPHQHGLFAIFIPLATVIGAISGAVIGASLPLTSPEAFYRFWVPFALLVVAQTAFWRWMRSLERPRNFAIVLYEPVGAEITGLSLADGVEARHQLKLPATL